MNSSSTSAAYQRMEGAERRSSSPTVAAAQSASEHVTTSTTPPPAENRSALFWYHHWSTRALFSIQLMCLASLSIACKQPIYVLLAVIDLLFPKFQVVNRDGEDDEEEEDNSNRKGSQDSKPAVPSTTVGGDRKLIAFGRAWIARWITLTAVIHGVAASVAAIVISASPSLSAQYANHRDAFRSFGVWNPAELWVPFVGQLLAALLTAFATVMLKNRNRRWTRTPRESTGSSSHVTDTSTQGGDVGHTLETPLMVASPAIAEGEEEMVPLYSQCDDNDERDNASESDSSSRDDDAGEFVVTSDTLTHCYSRFTPGRTAWSALLALAVALAVPSFVTGGFLVAHVVMMLTVLIPRKSTVKWILLHRISWITMWYAVAWALAAAILSVPVLVADHTTDRGSILHACSSYVLGESILVSVPWLDATVENAAAVSSPAANDDSSTASSSGSSLSTFSFSSGLRSVPLDLNRDVSGLLLVAVIAALWLARTCQDNMGDWRVHFTAHDAELEAHKATKVMTAMRRAKMLQLVKKLVTKQKTKAAGGKEESRGTAPSRRITPQRVLQLFCHYVALLWIPVMWITVCVIQNVTSVALMLATFAFIVLEIPTVMRMIPWLFGITSLVCVVSFFIVTCALSTVVDGETMQLEWTLVSVYPVSSVVSVSSLYRAILCLGAQFVVASGMLLVLVIYKRTPSSERYYHSRDKRFQIRQAIT